MNEVLVRAEGVSKKFCRSLKRSLWYGMKDLGRELSGRRHGGDGTLRADEFWAVNDVSFELRRGECLGLIGHNGAGKTTLLRMLNGLIKPDRGRIEMHGRVGALIALGAGFNPVLTGRENIYVNAAILGIPRKEVDARLDAIIAFSELHDFIDTPVQSYSSGMKVRLGFAVAINVKPDILIIDEVLAVGDQKFRRKARNAMQSLIDSDVALIFISHNIHEVLGITRKTLQLDHGRVVRYGDTRDICAGYMIESAASLEKTRTFQYMPKRSGDVEALAVNSSLGLDHNRTGTVTGCDPFTVSITFHGHAALDEPIIHVFSLTDTEDNKAGYIMLKDHFRLALGETCERVFTVDLSFINPGHYRLSYELASDGGPRLEGIENLLYLDIKRMAWLASGIVWRPEQLDSRMFNNARGASILPVSIAA
jgi:lipopolysaccharide transport system ATP-binding protein